MILDLKELGFKVALVSNSGARLVAKILKALRLDSAFEVIVTSSDAPPKPSTEPYLRALKLLNGDKARAIYVGDRDEAELYPAKQLGIHTILIDRTGSSALPHWADTVVTAPSEVVDAAQHLIEG